jgi:lysophospholipase L1-like esterase
MAVEITALINTLPRGPIGPQGIQGEPGIQGIEGPEGPTGPPGSDATVTPAAVQTALAANPSGARGSLDLTPFQRSGGAAAIHAALKANRSCGIAVVGDSTGNGTDEWVYLLADHIADTAPGHKVVHRVWSGSAWTESTIQDPGNGERRYNHPASLGLSASFGGADVVHAGPDLVIEAKIIAASWAAVAGKTFVQQWGSVPNRNWRFSLGTGTVNLQWYESDGTTLRFPAGSSAIPFVDGQPMWVRVFLDVDNGAGQYAVTHYYSTDGVTWTTAGTTTGATGVTTVNNADFDVEMLTSAFTNGGISGLRIRSSLAGPTENNIAIDNAWRGAVSNDELTLTGDPVLRIDNMSVSGWNSTNATQAQLNNIDHHGTLLAFISLGHNEGYAGGPVGRKWTNGIKAIADILQARCPMAQIVIVGQNPEAVFSTIDQYQVDGHALRIAQLAAFAAREGYGFLNFFRPFHDSGSAILDLVPDGIHPEGAGTALMVSTAADGYDQARF